MEYLVYLPFTASLILLLYLYKRDKTIFSFSGWLVMVYTFSCASSIVLEYIFIKGDYSLESTFFFISGHFLFIFPLLNIRGDRKLQIKGNEKLIYNLARIFSILGIFAIIYYIPSIIDALSGNFSINRLSTVDRSFVASTGFLSAIMAIIANSFVINLLLYFYSLEKKWPKKTSVFLFISSLSFIALSLAWVGRDGIVLWGMTFISLYFLFKWNFDKEKRKRILRPLLFISVPALILFIGITFSRFSELAFYKSNPAMAVLDYFGQQQRNFSVIYGAENLDQNITTFNGAVATFSKLGIMPNTIIKNNYKSKENEAYMQKHYKTSLNIFGTYLSTFITNFGKLGTIIFGVIWFIIFINVRSFNYFSTLLLYVFFYQILLHGVFYYRLALGFGDINIYLVLFLYLLFKSHKS